MEVVSGALQWMHRWLESIFGTNLAVRCGNILSRKSVVLPAHECIMNQNVWMAQATWVYYYSNRAPIRYDCQNWASTTQIQLSILQWYILIFVLFYFNKFVYALLGSEATDTEHILRVMNTSINSRCKRQFSTTPIYYSDKCNESDFDSAKSVRQISDIWRGWAAHPHHVQPPSVQDRWLFPRQTEGREGRIANNPRSYPTHLTQVALTWNKGISEKTELFLNFTYQSNTLFHAVDQCVKLLLYSQFLNWSQWVSAIVEVQLNLC